MEDPVLTDRPSRVLVVSAGFVCALCWAAHPVAAQTAGSRPATDLSELRFRVRPGETVLVTSNAGDSLRGTLRGIDVDRGLVLVDVNRLPLRLPASGIHMIRRQYRDPLGNGALIGALHGLVVSLLWAALGSDEPNSTEFFGSLWLTAPLGAGFGAWVDSLHQGRELVFRQGFGDLPPPFEAPTGTRPPRFALAFRVEW
jgi:hypothetical protein